MAFQPPPLNISAPSAAQSTLTAGAISTGAKNWQVPAGLFARGTIANTTAQLLDDPITLAVLIIGVALLVRVVRKG